MNPIYTSPRFLPPAQMGGARVKDTIVSHGASMGSGCEVESAIVGLRSRLESGVKLKNVMMMGSDFYESDEQRGALVAAGKVPVGIGANTVVENAIIDKNARIGSNCKILNKAAVQEAAREDEGFYIRSGIVCVLRNGTIANNTTI